MDVLNDDIIVQIANFLLFEDILRLKFVCIKFRYALKDFCQIEFWGNKWKLLMMKNMDKFMNSMIQN